MNRLNVLKEYYIRYLVDVRRLSESSVNHYLGALKTISKYLVNRDILKESIYEITQIEELEETKEYLYAQPDFIEKDRRGNRMYSAGLNNYVRFALGEDFSANKDSIVQMDLVIPIRNKREIVLESIPRNGIIKNQSLESAHYECEIDSRHSTFISASTGRQYMEGHHAIPIKKQEHFDVSLDVYANVICLCPICHRLLHYGLNNEKRLVLDRIYYDRADRLAKSGIKLSMDEFASAAI